MGYDMYFRGKGYADGDGVYFHVNIWGMGLFAEAMADRGMAFDAGEPPAWPEPPAGMDWDAYADGQDTPAMASYREAVTALLSWHGSEVPGIPLHKFGTNDGWIVTPDECEAAVRIGREAPLLDGDWADKWLEWLDYMDRARSYGGFEVH